MAQPARLPDPETTIAMDPQPPHPNEDPTPAPDEGSSASPTAFAPATDAGPIAAPANTNPNSARKYLEHPLQALLVTVVVFLFGFVLTQTNDRITQTNDRISRLEDKVDAGFAQQDAKFDERFAQQDEKLDERFAQQDEKLDERFAQQDEKLDEINLKLTALIAALNATAEVEAALDGRLLDPNAATTDKPTN